MIILITGATHTGKTLLAQKMLEKYKYPYCSIDHIKMGLIRSGNTFLTPEDDAELTEYLWPIIREMIKTAVENEQDLIVEGCYVPFGWRKDFDETYLKSIRFICLAFSQNYIKSHFKDIIANSSAIEKRLFDSDFTVTEYIKDNQAYINGFTAAGEKVTVIDDDYIDTVLSLI